MSGKLPAWLADWLGVASHSSAGTIEWQLTSRWAWMPWATLLLVVAAIVWTFAVYARESSSASRSYRVLMATLRIFAIALLLVMLAQWAFTLRVSGPPAIALVIDNSASMGLTDRCDDPALKKTWTERLLANNMTQPTRLNIAKTLITHEQGRALRALANHYRVAAYASAGSVKRLSNAASHTPLMSTIGALSTDGADNKSTRLGDALLQVRDDYRGAPPAAILLFSDGVVTGGVSLIDAAQQLRSAGIPLYAVAIGSPKRPHDIEISDMLVDDFAFVNDVVSMQIRIKSSGLEGQSAKLVLRREGVSAPLAEQAIVLPADEKTLSIQVMDRPTTAGEAVYKVEIKPRDDEQNKANNQQKRSVSVRDDKIRVLLAQGYPNYEFRFLKPLLERDQRIELSTYLQGADPEYAQQDKTALRSLPATRDELLAYDVVILGDLDPRVPPTSLFSNLRSFVSENGGGLALVVGSQFLPRRYLENSDFAALLPVRESLREPSQVETPHSFNVRPTSIGLQHPIMQLADSPGDNTQIWSKLAPIYWQFPIGELKPAAQTLAEGGSRAAIIFQYVGAGRVLFHTFDSSWRWRIGNGDKYFARYWLQAIRFLAHGKLSKGRGAQLTTDRREYRRDETAQTRAKFLGGQTMPTGDVTALVNSTGQPSRRVTLHRNSQIPALYDGSITELKDGEYEVVLLESAVVSKSPPARFSVVAPLGELARLEANTKALAEAAETTRGKYYTLADADRLWADLPAGRPVLMQNLPPITIWNRWSILAAFLSCLTSEWILRKRMGML
jgi:hypothetical protein